MANQAKLEAVLTLKDKMTPGLKNAEKGFGKFGASIGRATKAGVLAITAVTTAVGIMAFKSAGNLEKTRIAFDTMLGSAEDAGKLLKDLTDFAKRTPFDLPGVQNASKQLIAVGASTKDNVIPMLKAIGDVSAGTNAPLERMILNFGQVATQGKLTGRELRDFNVLGVPLIAELADMFDVSTSAITDMVSASEVGFEDVKQAFENMSGAGGKFEDLMTKQSNTLPGKIENIKDSFGILTRAIIGVDPEGNIAKGGLFDKFSGILSNVLVALEEVTEMFTTGREELNEMIQEFDRSTGIITWVKDLWSRYKDVMVELWQEVIVPFIPTLKFLGQVLLLSIVGVLEVAVKSLEIFMDNVRKIKKAWADTVNFFSVSASGLSSAVAGISRPVGMVRGEIKKMERITFQATETISGSTTALGEQSDAFKEAEKEAEKYKNKIEDLTSDTLVKLTETQNELNQNLLDADTEYNQKKIDIFKNAQDEILEENKNFKELMTGINDDAEKEIAEVITGSQDELAELKKEFLLAETDEEKAELQERIDVLNKFLSDNKNAIIEYASEISAIREFEALDEIGQIKFIRDEKIRIAKEEHSEELALIKQAQADKEKLLDDEHKSELTKIEEHFEDAKKLALTKWQELYEDLRDSGATQLIGDLLAMAQNLGATVETRQATLVGPGGDKKVVTVGSDESKALFGLGYKLLAKGGNLNAGEPAIVGEKGPELFIPKTGGTVVPNDKMGGGATTINFNNATVRNDSDLDSIISAVKQSLNRDLSVEQLGI